MADMDNSILKGICSKVIFPEFTFAKSKISLIRTINASPLTFIAFKYSFCFSDNSVFNTTLVKPIIAFIGVLISWLIFDRNCCLAFTASSAICLSCSALLFATINSFSNIFWAVTSLATITTPITIPLSSLYTDPLNNTSVSLPSL